MLGRIKYIQLNHQYLNSVLLGLILLLRSWKDKHFQDQIQAELINTGGNTLHSEIHKRFNNNKEELPEQWNKCVILAIINFKQVNWI